MSTLGTTSIECIHGHACCHDLCRSFSHIYATRVELATLNVLKCKFFLLMPNCPHKWRNSNKDTCMSVHIDDQGSHYISKAWAFHFSQGACEFHTCPRFSLHRQSTNMSFLPRCPWFPNLFLQSSSWCAIKQVWKPSLRNFMILS